MAAPETAGRAKNDWDHGVTPHHGTTPNYPTHSLRLRSGPLIDRWNKRQENGENGEPRPVK